MTVRRRTVSRAPRVAVLLAVGCLSFVTGCREQEIQFSRVPTFGVADAEPAAFDTTLVHTIPFDGTAFTRSLSAALQTGLKIRTEVDNLVCERHRTQWVECIGGYAMTDVTASGPITMKVEGGRLIALVPLKYEVAGRGYGWGARFTERKQGHTTVELPIEGQLGPGYKASLAAARSITVPTGPVQILKTQLDLAAILEPRMRAPLDAALQSLRDALPAAALRQSIDLAWKELSRPIPLINGLMLHAEPQRIHSAGFANADDGSLALKIAIVAKARVFDDATPPQASTTPRPLPDPSRAALGPTETRILLPLLVSADGIRTALRALIPVGDVIETQADQRSMPLRVKVQSVDLKPAHQRFAVDIHLTVVEPQRLAGMNGRAYLMARPVWRADTGMLEWDEIGFPTPPRGERHAAPSAKGRVLRIGEEPLAGRIQVAGRLPLGEAIAALAQDMTQAFPRQRGDRVVLTATFPEADVVDVYPGTHHIRLLVALRGTLTVKTAPPDPLPPSPSSAASVARTQDATSDPAPGDRAIEAHAVLPKEKARR